MKTNFRRLFRLYCTVVATAGIVALAGCSAETKLTPKEQANIKGNGVMPPEARAKMANMMQDAQAKMAADRAVSGDRAHTK